MHLVIAILFILATWYWGDWRNWRKYNASMLFVVTGNLLYNFLYANNLLWQMTPDFSWGYKFTELTYTFISLPLSTLLFLTNFPQKLSKQFIRICAFIGLYAGIELIVYLLGGIRYHRGWNYWLSIGWDCMMFPMVILNFKNPLLSYLLSLIVLFTMLLVFPIIP